MLARRWKTTRQFVLSVLYTSASSLKLIKTISQESRISYSSQKQRLLKGVCCMVNIKISNGCLSFPIDNPITTRLTTDKLNAVVLGNGRIAMTCITDANPPPSQYQFYRNGVYLRTSFTGLHVIHKARYFDAGTYLCEPLNRLGSGSNGSVKVSVVGK